MIIANAGSEFQAFVADRISTAQLGQTQSELVAFPFVLVCGTSATHSGPTHSLKPVVRPNVRPALFLTNSDFITIGDRNTAESHGRTISQPHLLRPQAIR